MAHDFNNILANIRGALQVALLEHPKNPAAIADTCREIDREINEASELVRQLMLFGSPPRTPCRWTLVNERIRLLARLMRRMISKAIVLETDLPAFETVVRLDPAHFTRILMNLVLNARDAMPHGGKLNISMSWVHGRDIVSPSARIRCDRQYVCIKIADTGVGIAPAALKRVFDPFYTTKRAEQGTGLGLSIVQSILHRCRGCVTVESKESQGTTFRCYLPGKLKDRPAKKCETVSERAV